MGGNVKLKSAEADKMDMSEISRTDVVKTLKAMFKSLNQDYLEFDTSDGPIWTDFSIITDGSAFTGSSSSFFDLSGISDEEFLKHKPVVGDIDVTIPIDIKDDFGVFLKSMEGVSVYKDSFAEITYLGISENNAGNQFNTLFNMSGETIELNLQVDFELKEWSGERSSDYGIFINSSDWGDIKKGLKGSVHKMLIFTMTNELTKKTNVAKVKPTGNVSLAGEANELSTASTSGLGTREKFIPLNDDISDFTDVLTSVGLEDVIDLESFVEKMIKSKRNSNFVIELTDKGIIVDGREAFLEVPTRSGDGGYQLTDTSVDGLHLFIFGSNGDVPSDAIYSFGGLVDGISKSYTDDQTDSVFTSFVERLFGEHGAKTERVSAKNDFKTKITALLYFVNNCKVGNTLDILKSDVTVDMVIEFYEKYTAEDRYDITKKKYKQILEDGVK